MVNGEEIDIALDPLEGTNYVAKNLPNSFSVLAATKKGNLLSAPDTYMEKIAIGSNLPPRDPQPCITKYIFPGGYTPSMSELSGPIERSGLILSDTEILRLNYALTLKNWKERFLNNKSKVLDMFDEKFFRMWEFYLTSCEMAFKWGDQVVFQLQLTKDFSTAPVTRDYIYK